jgi:hypothetical protein
MFLSLALGAFVIPEGGKAPQRRRTRMMARR